ncbi:hypothetical protein GCM10018791_62840 [Streptomyces zaomyceticus]|nr:hypothetical protein GCM10018791_62840 [Streptomyces zaomyceticus]
MPLCDTEAAAPRGPLCDEKSRRVAGAVSLPGGSPARRGSCGGVRTTDRYGAATRTAPHLTSPHCTARSGHPRPSGAQVPLRLAVRPLGPGGPGETPGTGRRGPDGQGREATA